MADSLRRVIALFLALLFATTPASAAEHTKDSLDVVRKRVEADEALLIDVRERSEWRVGHLERARLIPLSGMKTSKGLEAAVAKLPKKTPIYVHCRSGGRCLIAGDLMERYDLDIRPLKAGYDDLLKAGFEKAEEDDD